MKLDEFISHRLTQKNFIHDMSLGALLTYHNLQELYEYDDKVILDKRYVWLNPKKDSIKIFLYENFPLNFNQGKIFTPLLCSNLGKYKRKDEEVFYQLKNLNSYTGKSKYHSVIKPIRIFEQRQDLQVELKDFDFAGREALKDLHDEWVQYKLSLPKTHRISFPTARYRNTLEDLPIPTFRKAIYIKGQLYGFIVFSLENKVAFELSFCSLYWKPEFKILNGLNQYIFSYCLYQLQKLGIEFVNSGFVLNKNLKIFKHSVQKSNAVFKYTYEI